MIEICTNCEGKIGMLEKAYLYDGNIVCRLCHNKLNNIHDRPPTAKSKKKVRVGWCFFFAMIVFLVIFVSNFDATTKNAPRPDSETKPRKIHKQQSKTIEEEPVPTLDKSPAIQKERLDMIEKMIGKGVFCKVECLATIPKVWVMSRFYLLDYESKNLLIGVVYAYYFDSFNQFDMVQLKDCNSGRVVGDYHWNYGGLKMR